MGSDENSPGASGHNKPYNPSEEQLLIHLKLLNLSWVEIEREYNRQVAESRYRTGSALENKWRQLQRDWLRVRYSPWAYFRR